jgi:V8-like Glu-specific endopeptidase
MLITLIALGFTVASQADTKVIYGADNRLDIFETVNPLHLELAASTAAMVSKGSLRTNEGMTSISGSSLSSRGICKSERFADQITAANCSGFLVGDDLLVTAGHCIRSQRDCDGSNWIFDFGVKVAQQNDGSRFDVNTNDVYGCSEIVERDLSRSDSNDYALIRLDRKVLDRTPLTVRTEGRIETGVELVVIGHPTGLPTKIASGAWVRENSNNVYFSSNLDTFGGNSGSAVFDATTGMVEGILVRGETDYVYDFDQGCRVPKQCEDGGCRGEDVTRITNIGALMEVASQQ